MQNRRDFIKKSCTLCMSIAGLGVLSSQLSSCAPLPIYKGEVSNGMIAVPVSSFTEKSNIVIVRNAQMEFDIAIVKNSASDYTALEMKCTHQANPLTATKMGLFCSAHGSSFDLKGNVTKEPASSPLKKYKTEISNTSVFINIKS